MGISRVTVIVRNGDLQQALKVFKKKVATSGHLEELRDRREYTKPTTKKREQKLKAKRKNDLEVQREKLLRKF